MNKKALVAMSGGVDSSVCAYLALKNGYECVGATMRLCSKDAFSEDAADAARVCASLGIEHRVFDMYDEFEQKVIRNFVQSYEKGDTPNPCIECNRHLKFGLLYEKAKELGCDTIVTGHYARIEKVGEEYQLKKAVDISKDQSYVLYSIDRNILGNIYFPLGDITKQEARAIASEMGFVTAHKSDSQDICFVPDGDYASVISSYSGNICPEGDFVDVAGNIIGRHKGIIHYTVGQRKGLGIAFGKPMYVKEKDAKTNKVVLASNEELFSKELIAKDFNFLIPAPVEPLKICAKIRYNQTEQPATLYPADGNKVRIVFDEPQRAIAKGQAVVIYHKDRVCGGGTIT